MARYEDVLASNPIHEEFKKEVETSIQTNRHLTILRSQQRGSTFFLIQGSLPPNDKEIIRQIADRLQSRYGRTIKLQFEEESDKLSR